MATLQDMDKKQLLNLGGDLYQSGYELHQDYDPSSSRDRAASLSINIALCDVEQELCRRAS